MAITTLDGVIAGMQPPQFITKTASGTLAAGRHFCYHLLAGAPSAGIPITAATYTAAGTALTYVAGSGYIPFINGGTNEYLAKITGAISAQPGIIMLCDKLWSSGTLMATATTAQTVASVAFPPRDINGTTAGAGVYLALEITAAVGAGTPTITAVYTNSGGTGSRTATNTVAVTASSPTGTWYTLGLAAGDIGVHSVQTLQLSATMTSGTINLIAYRPIVAIDCIAVGVPGALDAISSGMPLLYDSSCLVPVIIPSTTTTSNLNMSFVQTNG